MAAGEQGARRCAHLNAHVHAHALLALMRAMKHDEVRAWMTEHLEHLECSLQPSPPGCFTKKLSEARGNGIGFVTAG